MKRQTVFAMSALMLLILSIEACSLLPGQPTVPPPVVTSVNLQTPVPAVTTPVPPSTVAPAPTSAPIPMATPIAAATAIPKPTSVPTGSVIVYPTAGYLPTAVPSAAKRISFAPGSTSATLQGNLAANGIDHYVLKVLAGQTMMVNISSPQTPMRLSISGADGQVLKSAGAGAGTWSGILPTTQDYTLAISTANQGAANYTLQVTIPPVAQPTPAARRISFAPSAISATVSGALPKNGMERWAIKASAGQTMMASTVTQNGNVMLIIFGGDGTVLQTDHVGSPVFSGILPITEDYYIDVRAWGDTAPSYQLQVTIPPK